MARAAISTSSGTIRSLLRRAVWDLRLYKCRVQNLLPVGRELRPVFIVGCGRSGTTILTKVLGRHPDIVALDEARDRWYTINPATDEIGLYGIAGRLDFGVEDASEEEKSRRRVITAAPLHCGSSIVIEKSTSNVYRIPWLTELYPQCRFINIVRDGRAVAASIVTLAERNDYRIAPTVKRNQWWGLNYCKRDLLLDRAARCGLLSKPPEALARESLDWTAAVVEWIMSVDAADKAKSILPSDRLLTVYYESLVANPVSELRRILDFIGLPKECANSKESLNSLVFDVVQSETAMPRARLSTKKVDPVAEKEMRQRLIRLGYVNGEVSEA